MELWMWALLLLAVGLSLVMLEIFVPSGGAIAIAAALSLIAAILLAFRQGSSVGIAVMAGALLGVPAVIAVGLQWWPNTPMGRRMLLRQPEEAEILPDSPRRRYLKGLIGHVGTARCVMLPSGAVTIDGKTIDAVSEGMPIDAGQRVRIVEVRANRVVVRPCDEEVTSGDATNPLSRPIDTIVPDPFHEPPA